MGVKPSSIQDLGTVYPPQWVTRMGSTHINRTAIGSFTAIPSPPAGKIRVVLDSLPSGYTNPTFLPVGKLGLRLWGSDGTTMGPQDGSLQFDATITTPNRVVSTPPIPSFNLNPYEFGLLCLAPGESVTVNITNFYGGTTKVVGQATWLDFDVANVTVVRQSFPDTNPKVIVPVVPAGKLAVAYFPGSMIGSSIVEQSSTQAFFWNPDDITHGWDATWTDSAGGSLTQTGFMGLGPDSYGSNMLFFGYYSMVLVEGQSLSVAMQEAVSTIPPRLTCMYKLIDSV